MPQIIHRPVDRTRRDCAWLLEHCADVTSQIGQDGILAKIFEVIGEGNKFCVEFGAWDGKRLSNTWNLIANKGWRGILMEGDAAKFRRLSATHDKSRVQALHCFVHWEGEDALDKILRRSNTPNEVDLMSIDVDGNDWHIWKSLLEYRPRVVLIEFNPTIPNEVYFVQDAAPRIHHGNSLLAMIELGKEKGYSLVCANRWDAFFVIDELYPRFKIPDNNIDAMYFFPEGQTALFQGYDGTLFTAGNRKLLWRQREFAYDELQLLPPGERNYRGGPRRASDADDVDLAKNKTRGRANPAARHGKFA